MAGINLKKWPYSIILAVVLALVIFSIVISVAPIYGFNITPGSTQGSSSVGGWFGELVPPTHSPYSSGG
jgi:hypothetical protein